MREMLVVTLLAMAFLVPSALRAEDDEGSPLHAAVAARDVAKVKALVAAKDVDLAAVDFEQNTALHRAAAIGGGEALEICTLLLQRGAPTEISNDYAQTPLNVAAAAGDLAVVKLLLSKGAKVDGVLFERGLDRIGRSPLHQAVFHGHLEVAQLLLDKGADVALRDGQKDCAMIFAARSPSPNADAMVALLLKKGASPNAKNTDDDTPLTEAAVSGNVDVFRRLLAGGAHLDGAALGEHLFYAAPVRAPGRRNHEIVALLLEKGAKVDWTGYKQRTALHRVAQIKPSEALDPMDYGGFATCPALVPADKAATPARVVALLLAAGAKKDLVDADGKTPLDLARDAGNVDVVALLEK